MELAVVWLLEVPVRDDRESVKPSLENLAELLLDFAELVAVMGRDAFRERARQVLLDVVRGAGVTSSRRSAWTSPPRGEMPERNTRKPRDSSASSLTPVCAARPEPESKWTKAGTQVSSR